MHFNEEVEVQIVESTAAEVLEVNEVCVLMRTDHTTVLLSSVCHRLDSRHSVDHTQISKSNKQEVIAYRPYISQLTEMKIFHYLR